MKKFFLFSFFTFLIVILSLSKGKAQWVTIPDANFVAWLQMNYPSCMNGNLMDTTCSGIVNENAVYCNNENIFDLTGIQYFNSLNTLQCSWNSLSSLPTIPNSLNYLYCTSNSLLSLPSLPNSLTELQCSFNSLTSLPPLPNALTILYCNNNLITNLPSLPNTLTELYCNHNSLTNLPTLPNSLSTIRCNNNSLINLPAFPNSLTFLYCGYNLLTSLPLIPNSLTYLYCNNNSLTSLPTLPNSFSAIDCSYNLLTNLPPLPNSLTTLDCGNNLLTGLTGLPTSLNYLKINNNLGIMCLPPLQNFTGPYYYFNISNTGISCLTNVIEHTGSIPAIDTMPICDVFNSNGCEANWNISGTTFYDWDSNCSTINDETLISNLKMILNDGSGNLIQQVITNWDGDFSFDIQLGNYSTSIDTTNLPFIVLCPLNNSVVSNLTSIDSMDYNVDFRLICNPGFDIGGWNIYHTNFFFPNYLNSFHIIAGDFAAYLSNGIYSAGILSGEVKVVINGPANYVSSLAGALIPIVNGDTLIYTIADFSLVNAATDFAFNVLTDSTAQIGDAVCFDVSVTPTAGDNNISNNTLTHCFAVSNSFDPNEKEVSPIGHLNYPFNNWLTYTIHFQNTGTAPAQHIQILDTLDSDLDESTFQLLSSSFDPMVQLFGNKVHFNFVNINLPDSTTNSEGSKGYVSYIIKPKQNLAIGTEIENTASIYFDFNSPVVTNTTLNTIVHNNGVNELAVGNLQLAVYPNPFSSQLTVELLRQAQHDSYTISITDILGRNVIASVITKQSLNTIDVSSLTQGIYFLKWQLPNGNFAVKKIVKE